MWYRRKKRRLLLLLDDSIRWRRRSMYLLKISIDEDEKNDSGNTRIVLPSYSPNTILPLPFPPGTASQQQQQQRPRPRLYRHSPVFERARQNKALTTSNKDNNRTTRTTSTSLTSHLPAVSINRVVAINNPLPPPKLYVTITIYIISL